LHSWAHSMRPFPNSKNWHNAQRYAPRSTTLSTRQWPCETGYVCRRVICEGGGGYDVEGSEGFGKREVESCPSWSWVLLLRHGLWGGRCQRCPSSRCCLRRDHPAISIQMEEINEQKHTI
jgi:hypothetical protein